MICAGEPGEKADFPRILAVVTAEERAERLLVRISTTFHLFNIFRSVLPENPL